MRKRMESPKKKNLCLHFSAISKLHAIILKPFHSAKVKHSLRYVFDSAYDPDSSGEVFNISPMLQSLAAQTSLLYLLWRLVSQPLDSGPKT